LQEIADVERKLQSISEREIELALQNHPVFEHLNGEKILSEEEAAALDSDFTLPELDSAAGEGKVRSASGIDGFSNGFIKKF
jgi:hypothetical protein